MLRREDLYSHEYSFVEDMSSCPRCKEILKLYCSTIVQLMHSLLLAKAFG